MNIKIKLFAICFGKQMLWNIEALLIKNDTDNPWGFLRAM